MIPFCGFMQANTLSVSGGKPNVNPAHLAKGISDSGPSAALDDSGDSFLQWVKQLAGEDAPTASRGEDRSDGNRGGNELNRPFFRSGPGASGRRVGAFPGGAG